MLIAGVDIETTGLSQEEGHRIIEICFCFYDSETQRKISDYTQRINPRRSIDPKAQEVHGISVSDLTASPDWDDVGCKVQDAIKRADVMVAHNMNFDGPFIALELARIGLSVPSVDTICTMENARWATPLGKKPRLKELCFSLGVDYDESKAHSAAYDVDVMMNCFFKGLNRGFFELPIAEITELKKVV